MTTYVRDLYVEPHFADMFLGNQESLSFYSDILSLYHSVQNLSCSSLLFKNKINVYRNKILPIFYMGAKLGLSL